MRVESNTESGLEIRGIPDFWQRVESADCRFLGLDYDGTLAPFHAERMQATPLPGARELLERIRDTLDTHLCIVSGRPVSEILELLGDLNVPIIGVHGHEMKKPFLPVQMYLPELKQRGGLRLAQTLAACRGYGALVEVKSASVAFHTRPIPDSSKIPANIEREWIRIAHSFNLSLRRFNGGIELRAPGRNKGTAVLDVLKKLPRFAFPVYLGDDETDEDVFRAIRGWGYGIRVGNDDAPTAAQGFLDDPRAVLEFLRAWCRVVKG
ncbi:MAG: trehalose-phosphatase [bacterium]